MAVRSGFFNSIGGDRVYDASRFAEYFGAFIGVGVFPDPSTNLQIQADSVMNVKVKVGKAWINGYILINDADYSMAIPTEAILNRVDRIVIRYHFANRDISIVRVAGTAASSPVAPALTRDANMFELSLATIRINAGTAVITSGMITDTRSDISVCGFVSSTISNIPYMTPNQVLISDINGKLAVSTVTDVELGYLAGVNAAIQTQINAKQALITGGASTIVSANLTASRALTSNSIGKVVVSTVTDVELGYLSGVSSALQTQINAKQAVITGGASTIVSANLESNKAVVSDVNGKVASSNVTSTELGYLSGVSGSLQSQLNAKLGVSAQAADSLKINGQKLSVGTSAPAGPAYGDLWVDIN